MNKLAKLALTLALVLALTFTQAAAEKPPENAVKGTFTDPRDNKTYKTAKIGEQVWMAENLNYEAEGSMCYDDEEANCQKYGRLYDWKTAKKACPSGWHLPSNAEWDKLLHYVDGTSGTKSPHESKTAGKYLGAKDKDCTDNYGFSALRGGAYYNTDCLDCGFLNVGYIGAWWSASEYDSERYCLYMWEDELMNYHHEDMIISHSVRCIKD
jgi:uncharacterized protein (TIGR02145 family)